MSPFMSPLQADAARAASYAETNRWAWEYLAARKCDSSVAYGPEEFAHAREILDNEAWIPWPRVRSVLCLAAGGGQQALLFASLGCRVTSVDFSPTQLSLDRQVAQQYGWTIECVEADMMDLSVLHGRDFDLVYQAVSACYVPDVRRVYHEVAAVLRPGGVYRVEHWNSLHIQLSQTEMWNGSGYCLAHPQITGQP